MPKPPKVRDTISIDRFDVDPAVVWAALTGTDSDPTTDTDPVRRTVAEQRDRAEERAKK